MNQALADLFLSLPRTLRAPEVLGAVCVALFAVGLFLWGRVPLSLAVSQRCGEGFCHAQLSRPWHRVLYRRAAKRMDGCALYTVNLVLLPLLAVTAVLQLGTLIAYLVPFSLPSPLTLAVRAAVTLSLGVACFAYLAYQPRATVERRMRWGFGRGNAVCHAVAWEAVILAVYFLWLYDAWFLPAFAAM